jgi:hypothetical protein
MLDGVLSVVFNYVIHLERMRNPTAAEPIGKIHVIQVKEGTPLVQPPHSDENGIVDCNVVNFIIYLLQK